MCSAALAATLALPAGQTPADWAAAAEAAGVTLAGPEAAVALQDHGEAWWLVARRDPCTAYAYPPATGPEARAALLVAARVLAGDEPLPTFDEEAEPVAAPPPDPAVICPAGPKVVAARATAPPDKPVAAPLVWTPPPAAPAEPAAPGSPAAAPTRPAPQRSSFFGLRWPAGDVVLVRGGLQRTWADLAGEAGLRAGGSFQSAGGWSLGLEVEADAPRADGLEGHATLYRQYIGARASLGRSLRASLGAGTSVVELNGNPGGDTVLWEPRVTLDGEVCAPLAVVVCTSAGVGVELFPVAYTSAGQTLGTTSPLVLRIGITTEFTVARSAGWP